MHALRSGFPVLDGELTVGGVTLSHLEARVGGTPFYAYDRKHLTDRVLGLKAALESGIHLHYAMKANPMPAVVSHMTRIVDGIDVASAGELMVALDVGTPPEHVSFAGPGKTKSELRQSVASGILVNAESRHELDVLSEVSDELGLPARVAIRVNPDFELKGSGMRMGGGAKPFGIDAEAVPEALRAVRDRGLSFEGLQIFSGSQSLDAQALHEAQEKSYDLALRLCADAPSPVRTLNLGGGLGVPYFPGDRHLDVSEAVAGLNGVAIRCAADFPGARIILELGRYLVAESGIYVSRVIDRKVSRDKVFLVTDGGLHHHLAASGNFGQVIRRNYPVAIGTRMGAGASETVTVVGPLCTPLDILADRVELPVAQPGDLVVVFQSGAYGISASPQQFLSHPPAREVLV